MPDEAERDDGNRKGVLMPGPDDVPEFGEPKDVKDGVVVPANGDGSAVPPGSIIDYSEGFKQYIIDILKRAYRQLIDEQDNGKIAQDTQQRMYLSIFDDVELFINKGKLPHALCKLKINSPSSITQDKFRQIVGSMSDVFGDNNLDDMVEDLVVGGKIDIGDELIKRIPEFDVLHRIKRDEPVYASFKVVPAYMALFYAAKELRPVLSQLIDEENKRLSGSEKFTSEDLSEIVWLGALKIEHKFSMQTLNELKIRYGVNRGMILKEIYGAFDRYNKALEAMQ